jgi:hypothetical protein
MSAQAARPGGNLSITLPPEVDTDLYRAPNGDLTSVSDEHLIEHYNRFGHNEGRLSSPAGSRQGFKALIPPQSGILKVGPGQWPGCAGPNVEYFGVQDSAGLRQRAIDHNEDPKDTPEKIHYVSPAAFREITEGLYQLGMSPLRPLRAYDTTQSKNECFAVLGRGD